MIGYRDKLMRIDELLHPSPEFMEDYLATIQLGKQFCTNKDIAFVGLARNIDQCLGRNIKLLSSLEQYFNNIDIVIFENDSNDKTKDILLDSKEIYKDKLHVLSDNYGARHFGSTKDIERTNAFANYRNICKNYVEAHLSSKHFIIVIDLDFVDISINGLLHSFGKLSMNHSIKAIAGNSYSLEYLFNYPYKILWNYDCWAFRHNWWSDLQNLSTLNNTMLWFGLWVLPPGTPMIRVNSAFGGMVVYDTKSYLSANYEGYDCEHVCFHKNLCKNTDFCLYLNPSQVTLLNE